MIVIPPLDVTDAVLVSSTAHEIAPAAYAGGTTYALNAFASVAGSAGLIKVYRSLQAANTGHPPASSPTWWAFVCDTYQVYSAGVSYGDGDTVIDPVGHRTYTSAVAGNLGNPLTDATKWVDVGATNAWAMFDYKRNRGTSCQSLLTVVLNPGRRITSLVLMGVSGALVNAVMTVAAATVYTANRPMTGRHTLSWSDYFFGTFEQVENLLLNDLPPYANAVLTITITGSDTVKCGSCVIGNSVYLGEVEDDAATDEPNFSVIDRDEFGEVILNPKRSIPETEQVVYADASRANLLRSVRRSLNAKAAVWSGIGDNNEHDLFDSFLILGIYRNFKIRARDGQAVVDLALEGF